jgi:sterol desaturase/sphingolipid hydroxylase (fatty acid hydroxylase superfamily)
MAAAMMAQPEILRLVVFVGLFTVLAICEHRWPRRPLTVSKTRRWTANLGIVALNTLTVRLLVPLAPFGLAVHIQAKGWGLWPLLGVSGALELVLSLMLLDLLIYWQHRLFHRAPLLWRLHRMHHADLDIDVSSGARFHPIEILLSLLIKMAAVVLFGIAPWSILLFEILLNATSMFNHANLRLPLALDRWLRLVVVTPDMHRVHHSLIPRETYSNFGFNLPWWDRLFASYIAQPRDGHLAMQIGLPWWRKQEELNLWALLLQPFRQLPRRHTP